MGANRSRCLHRRPAGNLGTSASNESPVPQRTPAAKPIRAALNPNASDYVNYLLGGPRGNCMAPPFEPPQDQQVRQRTAAHFNLDWKPAPVAG